MFKKASERYDNWRKGNECKKVRKLPSIPHPETNKTWVDKSTKIEVKKGL